ncbi:MAG: sigma-70 family RNA polymerase sigma factor [Myxococcota bacterium]
MRTPSPRPLRLVEPTPPTFASVYEAHAAFVRRTLRHLDVPAASVDDVLHDVFLVVHRRLHDFDHDRSMRSWLYGIARRVAMHHRRSGARRTKREHHAPTPPPPVQPDDAVAQREAAAWVEAFLRTLDPDQRAVFTLCDIEGLPAPEVAAATGTKLNTVYSRLRLARRRFERALAARDEGKASG